MPSLVKELTHVVSGVKDAVLYLASQYEKEIPEAVLISRTYSVTSEGVKVNLDREHSMPWRALDIINDGDDDVYVAINNQVRYREEAPLKKGESLSLDYKRQQINWFVMETDTGNSATVRVFAQT